MAVFLGHYYSLNSLSTRFKSNIEDGGDVENIELLRPPAPRRRDADGWKETSQPPTGRDSALLMAALPSKVTDDTPTVSVETDELFTYIGKKSMKSMY